MIHRLFSGKYDIKPARIRRFAITAVTLAQMAFLGSVPGQDEDSSSKPTRKTPNPRLAEQGSLHLRWHALDLVDWHTWGEEAFELAKKRNAPVFVSVGYFSCPWCYRMELESFRDPEVAKLLNENFVCIKVDREQMPALDHVFMAYMELAAPDRKSWPLNAFLTPSGDIFHMNSYLPRKDELGASSIMVTLRHLIKQWEKENEYINRESRRNMEKFRRTVLGMYRQYGPNDDPETLHSAPYLMIVPNFDKSNGGFAESPKFPHPLLIEYLIRLQQYSRPGSLQHRKATEMVEKTLTSMMRGSIVDQVGGGFHRYAKDAYWRLPNFEKMLYDQALVGQAYLNASVVYQRPDFLRTGLDVLEFMKRDLGLPEGAFGSSIHSLSASKKGGDLDSEHYYGWKYDEIKGSLSSQEFAVAEYMFGLKPSGNLQAGVDLTKDFTGLNLLAIVRTKAEAAKKLSLSASKVEELYQSIRTKLLAVREKRIQPVVDRTCIVSWNAAAASALLTAYKVTGEIDHLEAAKKTVNFLLENLYDEKSRTLFHSKSATGIVSENTFGLDYSLLTQSLLDLYESEFDPKWLELAQTLTKLQIEYFGDPIGGGFFESVANAKLLIHRPKVFTDADFPGTNSVAASNLRRLATIFGSREYEVLQTNTLAGLTDSATRQAVLSSKLITEVHRLSLPRKLLVFSGDRASSELREALGLVHKAYLPDSVLAHAAPGGLVASGNPAVARLAGTGEGSFQVTLLVDGKPSGSAADLDGLKTILKQL